MSEVKFEVKGLEELEKFATKYIDEVNGQIQVGVKIGINKSADLIAYGRVSGINGTSSKSKSVVSQSARKLNIPLEHMFYRTFVRTIKVSSSKTRSAKPYASVMLRADTINVVDFLVRGNAAKAMYGYSTRKKGVSGKVKPNMKSLAAAARLGGRKTGKVKIDKKTYSNAFIEDGATRLKKGMEKHYVENLGAKPRSALGGARYFLFQKKNKGQKKPYPSKVIKLEKDRVLGAVNGAISSVTSSLTSEIANLQNREINKRLKKLGFEMS